ncbi:hypothetical protein [Hydrogenimonas sp.]
MNGSILPFGWRYILPVWGVTLLILTFGDEIVFNLGLLAVSFGVAYLFYVPVREPFDRRDGALLSPVDGVVERVVESAGEKMIRIRKSRWGSTAVFSPLSCEAVSGRRLHGLFLDPESGKALTLNERGEIDYRWKEFDVRMKMLSGFYALGIPLFVRKGEVRAGEPHALMTDGIVEIALPQLFEISVREGERVRGGSSVLGYGGI